MTVNRDKPIDTVATGRSRPIGAAAGLVPASLIALLFIYSGSGAAPSRIAVSLGLVALIAASSGWLAGPLAGRPHRLLVATVGYAIAVIATTTALSVAQGVAEALAEHGLDPVAIAIAIGGRAIVAAAGMAYLIVPALVLGSAWSISARGLARLVVAASG